jgi:hypothetical protein
MIATAARPVGLSPTAGTGSTAARKGTDTADKEVRTAKVMELISRGVDAGELRNAKARFKAGRSSAEETESTRHCGSLPESTFRT